MSASKVSAAVAGALKDIWGRSPGKKGLALKLKIKIFKKFKTNHLQALKSNQDIHILKHISLLKATTLYICTKIIKINHLHAPIRNQNFHILNIFLYKKLQLCKF